MPVWNGKYVSKERLDAEFEKLAVQAKICSPK